MNLKNLINFALFVPFTCFYSRGFLLLWRFFILNRHRQRELVFLLLFENTFTGYSLDELIEVKLLTKEFLKNDFNKFVTEYFQEILKKAPVIDDLIEKFSLKWGKGRISKVALIILRIAIYELIYRDEIPVNVAINEAVELSKKYGSDKESSFINGILGGIARDLEQKNG